MSIPGGLSIPVRCRRILRMTRIGITSLSALRGRRCLGGRLGGHLGWRLRVSGTDHVTYHGVGALASRQGEDDTCGDAHRHQTGNQCDNHGHTFVMLGHLRLRTSLRVLRSIGGMGSGDHGACATESSECTGAMVCVSSISAVEWSPVCALACDGATPTCCAASLGFLARRVNHVLIELGSRSGDDGGHGHADYRTCDADLRRQQKRCHRGQGTCQRCENDIPLKKFFTVLSMFRYGWRRDRHPRLIVFVFTAYTPRLEVSCHFAGKVSGRSQYCVSVRAGPWL